ncbi:hypothetical protein GCM10007940_39690 [Portibacter lacus]|uniref:Uncharacterized protein n=1 Tax=Portibacter lacus TaxID=1099794 RepID=A0AA37SWU1_9BACT|nr:hypothetical protein GCM10007940_39690 [Portibacter lacus]
MTRCISKESKRGRQLRSRLWRDQINDRTQKCEQNPAYYYVFIKKGAFKSFECSFFSLKLELFYSIPADPKS